MLSDQRILQIRISDPAKVDKIESFGLTRMILLIRSAQSSLVLMSSFANGIGMAENGIIYPSTRVDTPLSAAVSKSYECGYEHQGFPKLRRNPQIRKKKKERVPGAKWALPSQNKACRAQSAVAEAYRLRSPWIQRTSGFPRI